MDIVEKAGGVEFAVRVIPRASRSEIVGVYNGALKIRIASPPVDGAANQSLIAFLAKHLSVSKSDIEYLSGHASRSKRVRIANISKSVVTAVFDGQNERP